MTENTFSRVNDIPRASVTLSPGFENLSDDELLAELASSPEEELEREPDRELT